MNERNSFEVKPFPAIRRATIDVLDAGQRKHMIHGLLEVDVSRPRLLIRQQKAQTGEALSFTAFIIYCLGQAVEQNRHMHAYRDLRNRLILFKEVDVSTTVEREIDGRKEVIPTIIRATNKKDVAAIHQEIRAAQSEKPEEASLFRFIQVYLALPGFVRRFFFRLLDRLPHFMKKQGGTVMLTAVGMFGEGSGWGIPLATHTLNVTVGGIADRPVVIDGHLETHEHLCLTVSFDHDIIDGAPAARFVARFKEFIEHGAGLPLPVADAEHQRQVGGAD